MVSAPRSLNTCPCVRVRGVIKSVITFFITVWSGATPAEDSGLPRMVVQTTAQILGCSLLCITFLYPSWENSEDVSLTFLTEPIYTTLSVALEEGQGLSGPGSVGFQNGTYPEAVLNVMGLGGTHYRQFILLIDFTSVLIVLFYISQLVAFFPTSVCLFVLSCSTYWWIYCYNLLWVFHRENMVHLSLYSNVWIVKKNFRQSFFFSICVRVVGYPHGHTGSSYLLVCTSVRANLFTQSEVMRWLAIS